MPTNTKTKIYENLIAVAGCLLLFSSIFTAQAAVETPVSTAALKPTSTYNDAFFEHKDSDFTIEIGDKNENNNTKVTFSAPAEDNNPSLVDSLIQFFGGEEKYTIEFDLVEKTDQTRIDEISQEIFAETDAANWDQVETKNNKVKINDRIEDIDVEYSVIENRGVKEDIIIKGAKQISDTYIYKFKLHPDLILFKAAPGNSLGVPADTYYFTDLDKNYVAHLLPLEIYDSLGNTTEDYTIQFIDNENDPTEKLMTITIADDWLTDPDRQYPVIIDPTIVHDTQGEFQAGEENRLETTTDPRVQLSYQELTSDVNTVGLWHFDDASGQTLTDSSGHGNDGQLGSTSGSETSDPSWTTTNQKIGDSALTYDGNTDLVVVPDDISLQLSDKMTIEAWLKGNENRSVSSSKRTTSSVDKNNIQFQIVGDKIYLVWDQSDGTYNQIWTGKMNIDGTGWSATQRTSGSPSKLHPQLQVVGDKIYYTFDSAQIWTAEMNTDGTSWSATSRTSYSSSDQEWPQLQVVGDKIYYVWTYIYSDFAHQELKTAVMNTDGTGWSALSRTPYNPERYIWEPQLQVVGDKIHYVWATKYGANPGVFYITTAEMNTDGTGFTYTDRTSSSGYMLFVQFQVVGDKIYYVYTDGSSTSNKYITTASMNTDGTGWSETRRTSNTPNKYPPKLQVIGNKIYHIWSQLDGSYQQIHIGDMNIDGTGWTESALTTSSYNKYLPQIQLVGTKIYYSWVEDDSGPYQQVWTATDGANLLNKGDSFGIGIDGSTLKPFFNAGVNSYRYSAGTIDYSNGEILTGPSISSNYWNHIAITLDADRLSYYLNGSYVTSESINNSPITNEIPLILGDGFNGIIDEFRISNNVLSPEEIYHDANLRPYGVYTSDVIDLNTDNPIFNSLSWEEYGVRTGDGETDLTTAGLVAKWKFNETSGTSASDSSGEGNSGTLSNFSSTGSQDATAGSGWTANYRRWGTGALMFDGSDDYVSVSDSTDFDDFVSDGVITVSAWVRYNDTSGSRQIINKQDQGSDKRQFALYSNGTDLSFGVNSTGQSGAGWSFASTDISIIKPGQWYYVVGVNDGTNIKLYINGALKDSQTGQSSIYNGDAPIGIGAYIAGGASNTNNFYGVIDSASIYDRALSQDEILSNYQMGQIEIQTRTGSDTTPDDGDWEAWMPSDLSVAAQLLDLDSDQSNWSFDQTVDTLAKANESVVKIESTGSLRVDQGQLNSDSDTVALWHLDETGGTGAYLKDSSGNSNHATPTGTTLVDGKSRFARNFNGTSDYILVSNSSELNFVSQPYTIEAWIKLNSGLTGNVYRRVVDKSQAGTGNGYGLDIKDYSNIRMLGNTILDVTHSFSADQWYHVAAVSDGAGSGEIYVNGEIVTSGPYDSDNAWTNTLQIGKASDTTSYFGGTIDEVRISNVARTPQEIAESYRMGASHYLTRSLASPEDLSSNNKISYYIASDSPGTHISTTAGESPYTNYQPDTNTVLLWHFDDKTTDLQDASSSNNHSTAEYQGIKYGVAEDNFDYSLNQYCGVSNAGEIDIDCPGGDGNCYIKTKEGQVIPTTDIDCGIALEDGSTGRAYIMYSATDVTSRFTVHSQNSSHFVAVRYNSGWQYNNNSTWTSFTPQDTDILIARVELYTDYDWLNMPIGRSSGKLGTSTVFDSNTDQFQVVSISNFPTTEITNDFWIKTTDTGSGIVSYASSASDNDWLLFEPSSIRIYRGSSYIDTGIDVTDNQWHHVAITWRSSDGRAQAYHNGQYVYTGTIGSGTPMTTGGSFVIGQEQDSLGGNFDSGQGFEGLLDEMRVSNTVRSAEYIRQAFEIGKRTHSVTIDFAADLDSGNLISGSGDTSFTVDATAYGLSEKGSNLYPGDKIIIRENYNGTEYIAQGTVTAVNESTGAVTIDSWDSGGTFPSGGYTANADVFKWQREYFDISGAMSSHIDAVDELSFQFLDGNVGRTFWIDDIHMIENDGYLTDETGSTILSTPARYIQYRAIMTTTDPDPTPGLGPITLDYTEGDLTMTAASTSQSYLNTNNNSAFNVQCNGVTLATTGDTITCYGSWNQTNWYAIDTATSPVSNVTIQDDENVAGWTGYPLGNGNVTIYVRGGVGTDYTDTFSFDIEKDVSRPAVLSITSVAGDTASTYYDTTDDSSTLVVYTADTDAVSCKWDESDLTYGAMADTCESTTNCTLDLSGEEAKTVYMRCLDTAGNYSDSSYVLNYTIDATPPTISAITSVAGDSTSPYKDNTDDGSTAVLFSVSADAADCKWDESDLTYGAMTNTCSAAGNCELDLTGEGAQTVYLRCIDYAGNPATSSYQLDYTIDTTPPNVDTITSVAGDTSSPYYDTTDDSSTLVLYTTDAADAQSCKWDESDLTYGAMANTCSSTTNCTLDLSGDGAKTVYMRCIDDIGNVSTSSYQLDFTIDSTPPEVTSITSVAGDTSAPYYDTSDDSSTAVVYAASGDAVSCKWDESDVTYGAMANTCTDTSNCDLDLSGEEAKTVYMRCLDTAGNPSSSSYQLDYTIDATPPSITSITDIAGDSSAPYYDTSDDSSTLVNYVADADAAQCKWDASDVAYDSMANTCTSTSQCTYNLSGEGAKTVYMRCEDNAGNKATSSYQVDYTIDSIAPNVTSITSVAGDTASPYYDGSDDGSTVVIYTADAEATSCKWDESDLTYGAMANTCTDTSNCTLDVTGEGAQTVYMRCTDAAGNGSDTSWQLDYNIDTTPPDILSTTSIAGDTAATYYDNTDDSSTLAIFTSDPDTANCKWDASAGTAYDAMAGDCGSATQCTFNLSGEGDKTVYLRCIDEVGNKATSDYQMDYTIDTTPPSIDAITSVAGDTAATYYDTTDDSDTQIIFTYSGDPTACKWSSSDQAYASMPNTCTAAGDCTINLSGQGGHSVFIRCIDEAGNPMTSSQEVDYIIDSIEANVTSITSIEGDTEAPYVDIIEDDNADIVYTATADAVACKWDYSNDTYDNMDNTCASTTNCTIDHDSDGAKTIYMRCEDVAGNKSSNSYQVDFEVDELVVGGGIKAQLDTSQPEAGSNILITFTVDMTATAVTNGAVKIRLDDEYDLSALTVNDVVGSCGDVTFTNTEIIYDNGIKITYNPWNPDDWFKAFAAGEDAIVFPFTGTLDNSDGQCSFTIGGTNLPVNPASEGGYSVSYNIYDNMQGTGTPVEYGDGVVHLNHIVIVTATVPSRLEFAINPVSTGTVNGATITTATTSGYLVNFGGYDGADDRIAAHDLVVSTNATDGYIITVEYNEPMTTGVFTIPDFTASNSDPQDWATPPGSGSNGYFGYTTDDDSLFAAPYDRFSADKWAKFEAIPREVAHDPGPVRDQTTRVGYRLELNQYQNVGVYSNTLMYIVTPTY